MLDGGQPDVVTLEEISPGTAPGQGPGPAKGQGLGQKALTAAVQADSKPGSPGLSKEPQPLLMGQLEGQ